MGMPVIKNKHIKTSGESRHKAKKYRKQDEQAKKERHAFACRSFDVSENAPCRGVGTDTIRIRQAGNSYAQFFIGGVQELTVADINSHVGRFIDVVVGAVKEHQIARLGFAPGDGFAIAVLSISPVGAERSESRKSRASFWKSGKP